VFEAVKRGQLWMSQH